MAGDIVLWMREIELLSNDKRVVKWLDHKYKGDYGYFASNYGKHIRYEGLPEDYGLCIKRSRDGVCLNLQGSLSHKKGSISIPMLKEAVESLMTDNFRGNETCLHSWKERYADYGLYLKWLPEYQFDYTLIKKETECSYIFPPMEGDRDFTIYGRCYGYPYYSSFTKEGLVADDIEKTFTKAIHISGNERLIEEFNKTVGEIRRNKYLEQ